MPLLAQQKVLRLTLLLVTLLKCRSTLLMLVTSLRGASLVS
jgi:hypothetical protein